MTQIENLNKTQLINLKTDIERQLKNIEQDEQDIIKRKDSVKDKTKLSQLTSSDRIFGIGYGVNTGKVHHIDYCDVKACTEGRDYFILDVGHKTEPFGVYNISINKERAEKPYFCTYMLSTVYFFTLRPETWEEDLKETLDNEIILQKSRLRREVNGLKKSIKTIIKNKKEINQKIQEPLGGI